MILSQNVSSPQRYFVNCNNNRRCSSCLYRSTCRFSMFYNMNNTQIPIKNTQSTTNNTENTVDISQFSTSRSISTPVENDKNNIDIESYINKISDNIFMFVSIIENVNSYINQINSKLDELSSIVSNNNSSILKEEDKNNISIQSFNTDSNNKDNLSIAPVENNESETILVQKKGLFGRTKWVEEKK